MPSTAIIVQARMTSTRLPGKVMKSLGPHSVLTEVLRRCLAVPGVDVVCCAVPEGKTHDPVHEEALALGCVVHRGDEFDVLKRYYDAAAALGAKTIMRATSDCPFIDPDLCAQVLAPIVSRQADYACNNMPPTWPHGLDCEAFTFEVLERAAEQAGLPDEREHVTPWMRNNETLRKFNLPCPTPNLMDCRLTVDYPEDLDMARRLAALLGAPPRTADWREIVATLEAHPEVAALNAMHHR